MKKGKKPKFIVGQVVVHCDGGFLYFGKIKKVKWNSPTLIDQKFGGYWGYDFHDGEWHTENELRSLTARERG